MRVADTYKNYKFDETKAYEKGGKLYVNATCECDRCGGLGYIVSYVLNGQPVLTPVDGGICYKCNGNKFISKAIRLYTEKEFEQMEKAKENRQVKVAEEREAKRIAEYDTKRLAWFEKNSYSAEGVTYIYWPEDSYEVKDKLKEAGFRFNKQTLWSNPAPSAEYIDKCVRVEFSQIGQMSAWGEGYYNPDARAIVDSLVKAERPALPDSDWIGDEGARIRDYECTLKSIRGFEGPYGYSTLVTFVDEFGSVITWWTSVDIKYATGTKVLLTGTIKKLDEYNGQKQTVMTRCKLKEA